MKLIFFFSFLILGLSQFGLKDILMECDFNENEESFEEKLRMSGKILEKETRASIKYIYKLLKKVNNESFGASETEYDLEGDRWFWIDDNSKILEMLVIPEIYEKNKDLVEKLLNFIFSLSDGQLIFRRKASNGMHVDKAQYNDFQVHNGLISLDGNLEKSKILISYRFHDGRQENKVDCFQTRVKFECEGEIIDKQSESFIESSQILTFEDKTLLNFKFGINSIRKDKKLAEINHSCHLLSNSPLLFCKAIFVPFSKEIKNLSIVSVMKVFGTFNFKFTRTSFSIDGKVSFHDSKRKSDGR